MKVTFDAVTVTRGGERLVDGIALDVEAGRLVGIVGPNGSGKTTLLKTAYRAMRPSAGSVVVGSDDVWRMPARHGALRVAAVLQDDRTDFAFTVRETVETGRIPHGRRSRRAEEEIVDGAMRTAGVDAFADRLVGSLSGGERQRVFVARALAQQTPVIVLDEPTNHLDVSAQLELLELLRSLPVTVVAALHDLNLAAAYCDEVHVVHGGRVVASGPTSEVLTPETILQVYGVAAACATNPLTGRPAIFFAPSPRTDPNTVRQGASPA
jgi:iron complex transport system ATP-binding protein